MSQVENAILFGPVNFSSEDGAYYDELWRHVRKKEHKPIRNGAPGHCLTLRLIFSDDFGNTAVRLELRGIQHPGGDILWYERFDDERPARLRIFPDFGGAWMWSEYGVATCPGAYFANIPDVKQVENDFDQWQEEFEAAIEPAVINHQFDWEGYHSRGVQLCRRLKRIVGDGATIFYVKAYEDPNSSQYETRIIS